MTVGEAMEKVSNREYRMRLAWEQQELNNPSRTDYYLMNIVRHLTRLPGGSKLADINEFKLPFTFGDKVEETMAEKERRAAHSRLGWGTALGGRKKK